MEEKPERHMLDLISLETERHLLMTAILDGADVSQMVKDRFKQLDLKRADLVDYVKELSDRLKLSEIPLWKEREDQARKIRKTIETILHNISFQIKEVMKIEGTKDLFGNTWRYLMIPCELKTEIDDEAALPEGFWKMEYKAVPDMEKIRASWADGVPVPGTKQTGGHKLTPYPNNSTRPIVKKIKKEKK